VEAPKVGSVDPFELLGRFLFEKGEFSRKLNKVWPGAFLPRPNPKKDNRLETSVFRITGLQPAEVDAIGAEVAILRRRSLKGRADVQCHVVTSTTLLLDPDSIPERHANIVGWSGDEAQRLMLATRIAEDSKLR
jgi:hypothetical protein